MARHARCHRRAAAQRRPQMSPEAQRIAIAEACGWTWIEEDYTYYGFTCVIPMKRKRWTPPNGGKPTLDIPDYLNDLNAMHEAEKALTADQARAYDKEQQKIGFRERLAGAFWMWHLPANWKAEAFLRTIGKWEASK